MRKLGIASLFLLMTASACSTAQGGDVATAHAKAMGFEVMGTGDQHAVVRIGKLCTGTFIAWDMGNGDQINYVYNNDGILIWTRNNNKATSPDQFKSLSGTAGCYI
jgi:hypothetical protein